MSDSPSTNAAVWIGNVLSGSLVLTSILQWTPVFAAFVAIIWYAIQILESDTFRGWRRRRRERKLAKLRAATDALQRQLFPEPSDGSN